MVVSFFVGLMQFIVEQFWVINTEAATLSSHAYHLVNHIKLIFGNFCSLELVNNNVRHGFILAVVHVQNASFGTSSIFLSFDSILMFIDILISFHITVDIFLNDVMPFFVVDLGLAVSSSTQSAWNRETFSSWIRTSGGRSVFLICRGCKMFKLLTHSLLSLNLIFIIQN